LQPGERVRVLGALVLVQVFFAVHYVVAKILLATVSADAWAALRVMSAAALLLAVFAVRGGARVAPGDLLKLAGFSIFGVVLNQICFIEGLSRTTPAHSSLINTTIPVLTVLFAVLLGREKLRPSTAAGIVLAMSGVLVLLRVDNLQLRAEWFTGDLLTQLNAASFSFFLVISRNTIRRVGSLPATVGVLCFGSLGVAAYGGQSAAAVDPAGLSPSLWIIAVYVVLGPTVLAYFLNYWALSRVESSHVALFVYLQPILASALSVVWLGEVITGRLIVSSALVFLGVLFATRDFR
jgi:drug/metabolite transporter (DMT)-like permease